ncbi:hypothetical protein BDR26DRAFT_918214 [Obelidium mucronatum]|nr:hypothetical protein BDR26DRAFT_918214 [Obelidium mucronatum]
MSLLQFCLGIVVEVEELLLVKQLVVALAGELVLPTSSITKYGERLESLQISAMTKNPTTEPAVANKPVTSLLQVSANAIADQLKRIDFEIYERITASELLLDPVLPGLSGGGSNNRKPNLLGISTSIQLCCWFGDHYNHQT